MTRLIAAFQRILSQQDGMNPYDRIHLENLPALEREYRIDSGNRAAAVKLARTLHALRRDKPALEIMQGIPAGELNPLDRLFMTALLIYDCNLHEAARIAAPVLIPATAILLVAGSGFIHLNGKGKEQ